MAVLAGNRCIGRLRAVVGAKAIAKRKVVMRHNHILTPMAGGLPNAKTPASGRASCDWELRNISVVSG